MQLRALRGRQHSRMGEAKAAALPAASGLQVHTTLHVWVEQTFVKDCRLQQASSTGHAWQQIYSDTIKVCRNRSGHLDQHGCVGS